MALPGDRARRGLAGRQGTSPWRSFEVELDRLSVLVDAGADALSARRWRRLMAYELEGFFERLARRFALEESGGYMAPLLLERPELSRKVAALLGEHDRLLTHLEEIHGEVVASSDTRAECSRLRDLIRAIQRHERSEFGLLHEATCTDLGVGD